MANNILKAIKNAGDAFLDTFNSKSQIDDGCVTNPQQAEQDDDSILSNKMTSSKEDDNVNSHAEFEEIKPSEEDDVIKKLEIEEKSDIKIDLDKPEIRLKTSEIFSSGGYIVGFSIQGRSHMMSGIPCQDYHVFEDLKDGWLLAVTSDGAGSAREAARGSKANCELALRLVKQLLSEKKWKERNYFPTEKEWYIEIKNVFEVMQAIIMRSAASQADKQEKLLSTLQEDYKYAHADKRDEIYQQLEDLKEKMKEPLESRDFNATIILLLISPQGMMAAHIGDGRMGYLSKEGTWKSLITPHKGDEASSTVFIPNNWNRQLNVPAFTMSDVYLPDTCVIKELPKAFVLMSDGCESFSWTCKVYDKVRNFYYDRNLPYENFFNPLIDQLGAIEDKDERINEMIDIINIGTTGGKRELDDRTMLLGVLE
ncbi:protein phosphatase 2C domain-containing protein [Phocaeicola vulgatus]|jgi:protein serine/threonine phosphatase|uniref:protein phosphatase 2C domain-containing protein n=1 Tax=Phocaeicola vulgatus TaxID=821 RepID=UPI001F3F156E|nr:protein phosphatase 2C domain-containing protein [Phocaeicola vulgatus]MCE9191222.1 protein phosphatase 2C domain-containing protein [Phocaeicola vulgatus]